MSEEQDRPLDLTQASPQFQGLLADKFVEPEKAEVEDDEAKLREFGRMFNVAADLAANNESPPFYMVIVKGSGAPELLRFNDIRDVDLVINEMKAWLNRKDVRETNTGCWAYIFHGYQLYIQPGHKWLTFNEKELDEMADDIRDSLAPNGKLTQDVEPLDDSDLAEIAKKKKAKQAAKSVPADPEEAPPDVAELLRTTPDTSD
jgi:hypothetical protein